jgi:hypothetical protein
MVKAISDFEIEIDKDEVCRYLGYREDQGPNSSISSLVDEEIEEAYDLIQPSCFYQLMDIRRVRQPWVILEDGLTITSEVLSRVLSHCHQVAIFVANIGQGLEERVAQLMNEERMLKATILDAVGSEAAEKTACYLEDKVRELANSNGAEITLRYSPGYCDWDVTQQRVLFEAMNSAPLGVSLTEECLMVPRKSVSGIIGVGRFEKRWVRYSPCRFCTKVDCPSRR